MRRKEDDRIIYFSEALLKLRVVIYYKNIEQSRCLKLREEKTGEKALPHALTFETVFVPGAGLEPARP